MYNWTGRKTEVDIPLTFQKDQSVCLYEHLYTEEHQKEIHLLISYVKVFRIIPVFRILRLPFHREAIITCQIQNLGRISMAYSEA